MKKVRWTADEHWAIGGIYERLGGRSLCYHGVMLPIESSALQSWPADWQQRLTAPDGLYCQLQHEFARDYPEMTQRQPVSASLLHVPQAATLETGGFSSYSPLYHLAPFIRDGLVRIEHAAVARIEAGSGGLSVIDREGRSRKDGRFDKCILAASAIVNVEIIATSLEKSTTSLLTDHYCIGIAVKASSGERIAEYRHEMLWHGLSEHHDLNANIFVVERPCLDEGDRLLLFMAVIEQDPALGTLSSLNCHVSSGRTTLSIESHHSNAVVDNYNRVSIRVVEFASDLLRTDLSPINAIDAEGSGAFFGSGGEATLDQALAQLSVAGRSDVYTRFCFPYGSYEHESCTHPIGGKGKVALTETLELTAMPGVHAVGPGAFPRLGIANPALTICSLSRWLASHLC